MKLKDPNRPRPWVIFKGGYHFHPRKRGPGIRHLEITRGPDLLASTAKRAETFDRYAPDAPRKASRTMPASWGRA